MDSLKLFYGVVGIDLGRGQVLVPEQSLNGHQAGTLIEKMGGEGVAQHVGTFLFQCRHAFEHVMHLIIYKRGRRLLAFVVQQETVGSVRESGIAQGLVLDYQLYHLR